MRRLYIIGLFIATFAQSGEAVLPADSLELLTDKDADKREQARKKIVELAKSSSEVVPALLAEMQAHRKTLRLYLAIRRTLCDTVPSAKDPLPALIATFETWPEPSVHYPRVLCAQLGEVAIPKLMEALQSPNAVVRRNAAEAFRYMHEPAPQAVPLLRKCLVDDDLSVRSSAILALIPRNASADAAIPDLLALVLGENEMMAFTSAYVLGFLGKQAVLLEIKAPEKADAALRLKRCRALANFAKTDAARQWTPEDLGMNILPNDNLQPHSLKAIRDWCDQLIEQTPPLDPKK